MTTYSYNPATEEYLPHETLYPGSGHVSLNKSSSVSSDYLYHIRLAYSRRFGDHGISAFAAYEQDETRYNVMSAGRRDLFSENKVELFAGQEDGRRGISAAQRRRELHAQSDIFAKGQIGHHVGHHPAESAQFLQRRVGAFVKG